MFVQSKNVGRLVLQLIFYINIFSCGHGKNSFKELTDHGLTIRLLKVPNAPGEAPGVTYFARLIPGKELMAGRVQVKTKMWYGMDSCFYLQAGQKKIYAEIIQPIANGLPDSFEYMLSFGAVDVENGGWSLIYQDKYLNRRKYKLGLNDK